MRDSTHVISLEQNLPFLLVAPLTRQPQPRYAPTPGRLARYWVALSANVAHATAARHYRRLLAEHLLNINDSHIFLLGELPAAAALSGADRVTSALCGRASVSHQDAIL